MKNFTREKAIDISLLLLRIAAGIMFFQVGGLKLFGWFGGIPGPLPTLILISGILEVIGGVAIILGLLTRPVAFILSGEMAFAFFLGHFNTMAPWPIQNHGEQAVLYCFVFLFMAAYGAGKYSIDRWWKNRKAQVVA